MVEADIERRVHTRFETELSVDYADGETFLFAYITNISEMGIFISAKDPLPVGTQLRLRFGLPDADPLSLEGQVVWVNPYRTDGDNLNPGMGVRFEGLSPAMRERIVSIVRSIAYLQKDEQAS